MERTKGIRTAIPVSRVWLRSLDVPGEEAITEHELDTGETETDDGPDTTHEVEFPVEPDSEAEAEEETTPIVAVTRPYRYAQDFYL